MTLSTIFVTALLLLAQPFQIQAWVSHPASRGSTLSAISRCTTPSSTTIIRSPSLLVRNVVAGISVQSIYDDDGDVQVFGQELGESVQRWLDAEWFPQEIHKQMGESVKTTFLTCHEKGEADLMEIMVQVADDLKDNWAQYDKDAFVNEWNVANYVSDFLTKKKW
eukprot:CAMPEP_0198143350 /NCGR_PEP_ID=MMETSP1443-20131203/6621_1 /TAXON_ID=186043 /ORGANISM="Entomoneis sp., Strain CCMP2396" /LENGTH=164 /DNA_ID=CAMNT_0043806575 /DNA_START=93 /DNA_END=587 /DNA_ORIENTATION=-